jgi:c-di-GMP-binding flagellar brake protein YcgR
MNRGLYLFSLTFNKKEVHMSPTKKPERKKGDSKSKKDFPAVERRKHPRFKMELPLDYSRINGKDNFGGIVSDLSEGGINIYLPRRLKIKDILKIEIFFAKKLELSAIQAIAEVVWGYLAVKGSWKKRHYGLQFQSIDEGNLHKLRILLKELKKTSRSKGKV